MSGPRARTLGLAALFLVADLLAGCGGPVYVSGGYGGYYGGYGSGWYDRSYCRGCGVVVRPPYNRPPGYRPPGHRPPGYRPPSVRPPIARPPSIPSRPRPTPRPARRR